MSSEPEQNEYRPPFESHADLVIGIDFGTTFSGVAYAITTKITPGVFSRADRKKIADNVVVIKSWPSGTSLEKIPTLLSYKSNPGANASNITWGTKVKLLDNPRIAHFKLGLEQGVGEHYRSRRGSTGKLQPLGGYLNDYNWHHPLLPEKKAVDYASDYLTAICDHIMKESLIKHFGKEFLKNQQISYVLTVPAIWSDKAKDLTKQAAYRAGIQRRNLVLITEPEAAALYCATLCKEVDLDVGDRFLICDAGGGTVDLISYKVCSFEPFTIEECSAGTGAACGSIYLDWGFQNLLRKRLGAKANTILTERALADATKEFDSIKREFNPLDGDCEDEFEIPLRGAPEMPHIGLEEGHLKLTKADIQSVFDPLFQQILALVKEQIDTVRTIHRGSMKTLFLVGGFGTNMYLYKYLEDKVKPTAIKQPPDAITAIMRGAVLHKLGLDFVKDRVVRKSYGVTYNAEFRRGHHPASRKINCLDGITRCENVMDWYAKRDDKLANGASQDHPFFRNISPAQFKEKGPLVHRTKLYVCDRSNPPEYFEPHLVTPLCDLSVDLRNLPADAITERTGPKGVYYRVDYDLGVTFGAAGIEFKFLYQGKTMGYVEASYY